MKVRTLPRVLSSGIYIGQKNPLSPVHTGEKKEDSDGYRQCSTLYKNCV